MSPDRRDLSLPRRGFLKLTALLSVAYLLENCRPENPDPTEILTPEMVGGLIKNIHKVTIGGTEYWRLPDQDSSGLVVLDKVYGDFSQLLVCRFGMDYYTPVSAPVSEGVQGQVKKPIGFLVCYDTQNHRFATYVLDPVTEKEEGEMMQDFRKFRLLHPADSTDSGFILFYYPEERVDKFDLVVGDDKDPIALLNWNEKSIGGGNGIAETNDSNRWDIRRMMNEILALSAQPAQAVALPSLQTGTLEVIPTQTSTSQPPTQTPEITPTPPQEWNIQDGKLVRWDHHEYKPVEVDGKPVEAASIVVNRVTNEITVLDGESKPTLVITEENLPYIPRKELQLEIVDGKKQIVEVGSRFLTEWPTYREWNGKEWVEKPFPAERYNFGMFYEWFGGSSPVSLEPLINEKGNLKIPETVTFKNQVLSRNLDDPRFIVSFVNKKGEVILGLSKRYRKLFVMTPEMTINGNVYVFGVDISFGLQLDLSKAKKDDLEKLIKDWENVHKITHPDIYKEIEKIRKQGEKCLLVGLFSNSHTVDSSGREYVPPSSPIPAYLSTDDGGKSYVAMGTLNKVGNHPAGVYDFGESFPGLYLKEYLKESQSIRGLSPGQDIILGLLIDSQFNGKYDWDTNVVIRRWEKLIKGVEINILEYR